MAEDIATFLGRPDPFTYLGVIVVESIVTGAGRVAKTQRIEIACPDANASAAAAIHLSLYLDDLRRHVPVAEGERLRGYVVAAAHVVEVTDENVSIDNVPRVRGGSWESLA